MDQKHQDVLKRMRGKIIDDLDVYNGIILPLTTEYILREEDVNSIKKGKTRQERAQILLDLLPNLGSHAFEIFHQSLRHHYSWLSDEIDKILESPSRTPTNDAPFVYPNLQPVSPLTVTREEMVTKLKNALENLQPNGYIALHGMKGFGKSCLTASTLKDKDLTLKLFNNKVYWIKFGYERNINEEILIQLNTLYHHIKNLDPLQEAVNSEPLEKTLKQTIEHHFSKIDHRNALLILDDVSHKEIVDKFDFTCKTLVITADIGVLGKRSHTVVKMDHGFTESETLGLFAKVLDVSIDQLPLEAKLIHDECKGMPLLIAMFAAQFENFKHDMKDNKGRWKYYLNSLQTKNAKNKVIEEFLKIQEATFDMCINQLQGEMRTRYENLAIFSEDVNIMPKTLEILWEEEPYSVDDQMLDFCHKSLAAKKWNDDLRSYIYGVHDLLLCHLRKKLTVIELRDKHRLFIEKYKKYCNEDFSKLPNDNYSFSYIGHHLEQAELFDEFQKLYMNFDFLQAKINYTGLSDLFIDLKKYRRYITNNGDKNIESNLVDLEKFLENHANTLAKHRLTKCLDLVQIALDYCEEGFVKDTARKLASSRSFSLYFFHDRNPRSNSYLDFCQEVITNANTVAFTNDPNYILVGSHEGEIILWDCENRKPKSFIGHNKQYNIKKIVLSLKGDYFLALSEDGTLKLFVLDENECISNRFTIPVQSPRHKQTFWKGFFETMHDDSVKTFSIYNEFITDMKFAQADSKIVACSSSGTVMLWNANGNSEWQDKYKNHRFGGVSFTSEDNLLHVMDETNSVIRIYKKNEDYGYTYVSLYNLQLSNPRVIYFSKHPVEDNCLVIVTDKTALYFKWFYNNNEHIHSYEKYIKTEEKDKNTYYVAATLTYDSRYLIIGDSKGTISVMKAFNPDDLITKFKGCITSLDSYWMYYEDFHLICGSERRLIHRWQIGADEKPKSVKKPLFDAKIGNLSNDNIVILKTSPNAITAFSGKKTIAKIESHHGKIINMNLYDDAKKVIYITESGSVVMYDMISEQSVQISKLDSVERFIDVLQIKNNYMVLCRTEDNRLQVWRNIKISHLIEGLNNIIFVHKVTENCVMTISKEGNIKYWIIQDFDWREIYQFTDNDGTIIYSCLSSSKIFLAALKDEQKVVIYNLPDIEINQSDDFKITYCIKHDYKMQLNCCQFSQDDKFLAIALDGGDISIIDLLTLLEVSRLNFHCNTVNQLHWSPMTISVPILLSVNCDELAWWNVAFLKSPDNNQKRRSRMGFSRSISSPTVGLSPRSSYKLPNSRSTEISIATEESSPTSTFNIDEFWSRKLPKNNDERPAFLGCVQLPVSCTDKVSVCVSDDFSKFLTVDIHGTVSNYTIFENSLKSIF